METHYALCSGEGIDKLTETHAQRQLFQVDGFIVSVGLATNQPAMTVFYN